MKFEVHKSPQKQKEFDVEKFDVVVRAKTRSRIAMIVVIASLTLLTAAMAHAAITSGAQAVKDLLPYAIAPLTAILAYYFGRKS